MRQFDTIGVGVGGMGGAACYHLAKRGRRVLGLERFDIPHTRGSSHGYTRIIRLPYYEDPSYIPLLRRAYELWGEMQAVAGEQLLHITGSIDAGTAESWVFKGALQSARLHDLPHDVLTTDEMTRRYPGYRLPGDVLGLYQPQGRFYGLPVFDVPGFKVGRYRPFGEEGDPDTLPTEPDDATSGCCALSRGGTFPMARDRR